MIVVSYYRVSSDEQAEKDISIPAQRKDIRRWVEAQGYGLIKEFVDEGESAYAPANKRPGFMEMISFCKKNRVQLILVHKLDRFSRNREESILFKSMLRKAGVTVKSISENYDPETPQGFLYEGMIEVINQFYSMNLATETLKGMKENAERGYHNGGRTPYGYRLETQTENGRPRRRLVPGPDDEVAIIREIFRLASEEGYGARSIASLLNQKGIPAPRSKYWGQETISAILSNPVYIGDLTWRRRKTVGRSQRKVTEPKERVVLEGAVPALIGRETFGKRKAIAAARPFKEPAAREGHGKYLLARLIHCGNCGRRFAGKPQNYRTRSGEERHRKYYVCTGYLTKGASVCPSNVIPVEWADDAVTGLLQACLCAPKQLEALEARVRERIEARRKSVSLDPRVFARRLEELDRRIANFYKAIGDGMDIHVCRQHIAELTHRKAELEKEAELVAREDYHARAMQQCIESIRKFASSFQSDFAQLPMGVRRQLVQHFIERIEVNQRDTFRVVLRIPLDDRGLKRLTEELEVRADESKSPSGRVQAEDPARDYPYAEVRGAISNRGQISG